MGLRISLAIAVVVASRGASAESCVPPTELRADLEAEAQRAARWNLGWGIGFSALAVGQFAAAASGAFDHNNTQGLWVGGIKSSVGALARFVVPLHIDVPAATGDACADRAALRGLAERTARTERQMFWLSHVGGFVVNAAGALVLADLASWKTGLLSFAVGYPVSLLSTYTMPRASWARVREPAWTASITATRDSWALAIAGSF